MCGLCGLSFVSTNELNNAKIFGENLSFARSSLERKTGLGLKTCLKRVSILYMIRNICAIIIGLRVVLLGVEWDNE